MFVMGALGTWAFKKEALGFGDVKLGLVLGSFLGVELSLLSLFLSFIFGCVIFNSESTITFNPTRLNQPSSHFTLSPTSGELRTSSRLDREGRDGADSRDLVALSSSPTYPIEASHPLLNLFSLNKCSEPIMWVRGGVEDMSEHLGRH